MEDFEGFSGQFRLEKRASDPAIYSDLIENHVRDAKSHPLRRSDPGPKVPVLDQEAIQARRCRCWIKKRSRPEGAGVGSRSDPGPKVPVLDQEGGSRESDPARKVHG
jgi:hypothetical protein